jgi:radical SAM superfamily enzyme YgiQ (UPF0313 family)
VTTLVLVLPPQHWLLEGFTSGLVSLANYVEQHATDTAVRLLDLGRTPKESIKPALESVLGESAGRVFVGVTTTTATYQSALAVAAACKLIDPAIKVIFGGHHSNCEDDIILTHHPEVDFVIRSEGERSLVELLRLFPTVESVPSLTYRRNGTVVKNPAAQLLSSDELDSLGVEFRDLDLHGKLGRCDHVTYVSARGCPLACSFCAVGQEQIRAKSVEQVVRDIELLVGKYKFTSIGIEDNFFAHARARTRALCDALAEFRRAHAWQEFTWDCQTRVESMTSTEVAHLMEAAGCDGVFLGVESLDAETLSYLGKTKTPERYVDLFLRSVLPILLDTKMTCYVNFQVGLPFEDDRHRERNIRLLKEAGALARKRRSRLVVCPMLHVIYPGTPLFRDGVSAGRFSRAIFEDFTRWEVDAKPVRRWLGRHFAHGTGGIPVGILGPMSKGRGFEVDAERVLAITNYLEDLRGISGIEVFEYEPFLAPGD